MAAAKQSPIQYCPKNALFLETESNAPGGRGIWYARVPPEHTIEDVLRGDYFGLSQTEGQTGKSLRTGDLIDIEPENARWRLQLRVMGCRFAVKQVITREQQRWDFAVKEPPGYRFVWKGDAEGAHWAIFKGETEVDSGFATEDECLARVEELRRDKAA